MPFLRKNYTLISSSFQILPTNKTCGHAHQAQYDAEDRRGFSGGDNIDQLYFGPTVHFSKLSYNMK